MKPSSATGFLIQGPHPPPCPAWWVRGVLPICACQAKAATPRTRVLNGGNAALQVAGVVLTKGGREQTEAREAGPPVMLLTASPDIPVAEKPI